MAWECPFRFLRNACSIWNDQQIKGRVGKYLSHKHNSFLFRSSSSKGWFQSRLSAKSRLKIYIPHDVFPHFLSTSWLLWCFSSPACCLHSIRGHPDLSIGFDYGGATRGSSPILLHYFVPFPLYFFIFHKKIFFFLSPFFPYLHLFFLRKAITHEIIMRWSHPWKFGRGEQGWMVRMMGGSHHNIPLL